MTPERLEKAIRDLGMNQSSFALFIGVDPRTMRRWIAEEAPVPRAVEIVIKLMEAIPLTPQQVTMLVNSRE